MTMYKRTSGSTKATMRRSILEDMRSSRSARLRKGEDMRPVPAHAGYYVTSHGRVFSTKQGELRELRPHHEAGKAPRVAFRAGGAAQNYTVVRLVVDVFLGPHHGRAIILRNGDAGDHALSNLRYATPADRGISERVLGERRALLSTCLHEGEDVLPISNNDGYYITSHGRVFSLKRATVRELLPDYGYGQAPRLTFSDGNVTSRYIVARLMASVFLGPRRGRLVIHLNGNTNDNMLSNLRYGTRAELVIIAVAIPTVCYGEAHHLAKLNPKKVRNVRRLLARGDSHRAVAERYGVTSQAIGAVDRGRSWRRVIS